MADSTAAISATQQNSDSLSVPSLLAGNHFGVTLSQIPIVKLEKSNFLLWKHMIMSIIKGHNLERFLNGKTKCPEEFLGTQVTRDAGTTIEMTVNPEYRKWIFVDQLLMGWLYSTMNPEIALRVMGASSSAKLWSAIEEIFVVKNKSRIIFLTSELQRTRKGSMSIDQYLNTLKQLADNLQIAAQRQCYSKCGRSNHGSRSSGYRGGRSIGRGTRTTTNENIKGPCQICGKLSHIAKGCWDRYKIDDGETYVNENPSALVASASNVVDPTWFADSGASNHVTSGIGNIAEPTEYHGQIKS